MIWLEMEATRDGGENGGGSVHPFIGLVCLVFYNDLLLV
jgi:hypothetical protein